MVLVGNEPRLVMGLDIASGSPASRTAEPHYSVVILREDGKVIYETQFAPLRRVVRLAWEYRPKVIAVDNVFELAPSKKRLAMLLSLLPEDTEMVQVTLKNGSFVSVKKILASMGYEVLTKPRSLATAYINAILALRGEGSPIRAVEHKTKIIISRGSAVGRGGSSAQRYARSMRASVLRMTRRIKEVLDRAGLSYDLIFRKSSGGLDSAVFIVYAPRSALRGLVKPVRNSEVRVVIKPVYKSIMFVSDSPEVELRRRYVIVGVDPGLETGLAAVDLSLRLVLLTSSRELDRSAIINRLYTVGIPVIVATDKNPPPDSVKKLASTLGVPLYVPPRNPSTSEKEAVIEWYRRRHPSLRIETTHERDALAAALMAYRHYERSLREVEERIREMGIDADLDEAKLLILRGRSVNEAIEAVVGKVLAEEREERDALKQILAKLSRREYQDSRVQELEKRVEELIRERELLKNELSELRKRVEELEFQLRHATTPVELSPQDIHDRTVAMLESRAKQLYQRVQQLEREVEEQRRALAKVTGILRGLAAGELRVLPLIQALSKAEIRRARSFDPPWLFVEHTDLVDVEGLKEVSGEGLVLFTRRVRDDVRELLWRHGVAVVDGVEPVYVTGDVAVVPADSVSDEVVKRAVKQMEKYREKLRSAPIIDEKKLLSIIEEYRREIAESIGEGKTGFNLEEQDFAA